ncbi:MAG: hypothetical protein C7B46_00865 [Sulfobacillus benefaciens]|uniref:SbsA Ig-like domain-containing protein n=1 Tax=Sulfobacillus benefaciens TaxID=453960 RepID=A0A2T2XM55_9FIRM|nr:MAG: hypothetical protein C7B46_00865 [Sulfobacillus benefaciens]
MGTKLGAIALATTLSFAAAGCGATHASSANAAKIPRAMAKPGKPIAIADGHTFQLSVPSALDANKPVSVADTELGILYLLPPHWITSQTRWQLRLAPTTGTADIARDSVLMATWTLPHTTLSIADVTQNVALVIASPAPGVGAKASLWAINLENGQRTNLHAWNPAQLSGPPFVAGRGVVAWWNPGTATATVADLLTGARQNLVGVASAEDLSFINGGLAINGTPVALPFLKPFTHVLPKGFKWAYPAGALNPIIAVPDSWVVTSFTGQNSVGILAVNPAHPSQHVKASLDACVACFAPTENTGVTGPDSPLLGVPAGTAFVWLSDHAVAYTLPGTSTATTYKLQVTEPNGGVVDASATVPTSLKGEATTILNSLWWP